MTVKLHGIITELTDKCFPWQNRRIRSTDDPWITDEIRRAVRTRMRKFKKFQRSRKWQAVKEETDLLIKEAKADYYQKALDTLNAEGGKLIPYKILKNIAIPDRPKTWTVNSLNPGMTDHELVEDLASYFVRITDEISPLDTSKTPVTFTSPFAPLLPHEAAKKI